MTTSSISSRHVRQVAELVKRLNSDEIRELFRLVPRLQAESAAANQQADLVNWAREQLAQHADQAHPMQDEDIFLADTTVADYFALPDVERERIWVELYATAIETSQAR
jgi:hypothetical protein